MKLPRAERSENVTSGTSPSGLRTVSAAAIGAPGMRIENAWSCAWKRGHWSPPHAASAASRSTAPICASAPTAPVLNMLGLRPRPGGRPQL